MMIDAAPIGFLDVQQQLVTSDYQPDDGYDLVLSVISWESRATATLPVLKRTRTPVRAIYFASSEAEILNRKNHAQRIMRDELGSQFSPLELPPSLEFDANARQIQGMLEDAFIAKESAIRVLVDMSCVPKRYLLFILGMGFKRDIIASLDLIYAEGRYEIAQNAAHGTAHRRGLISEGDWSSVQVPYLEARDYAPSRRDLCISVGAEITVALPLIERMDPTRMRLFEISDTKARVPSDVIDREKRSVDELLSFHDASKMEFAPHDVIGVANDILGYANKIMTCLAIGSKPHALAFGLAALADDRIEIVCRAPRAYAFGEVKPTGRFYVYSLRDRFDAFFYRRPEPTTATQPPPRSNKEKLKRKR